MKKVADIFLFSIAIALTLGGLSSCADELRGNNPIPDKDQYNSPGKEYFIAVKIFDTAETAATRAAFDSDFDDVENGDYVFNKGLATEKALCPVTTNDLDKNGFLTKKHFLLFFDEKGNKRQANFFIKEAETSAADDNSYGRWDFETSEENSKEKADKNYYTAFASIYMSFDGEIDLDGDGNYVYPDKIFNDGKILVVLNASDALGTAINNAASYNDVIGLIVKNDPSDSDAGVNDFLFRTEGTKRYFTMTSSMVVKDGEIKQIIPANFQEESNTITWYESPEKAAAENPYAMYVERLQSKYTTVFNFNKDGNSLYFGSGTTEGGYKPVSRIVYTSGTDFNPNEEKKLSYVKSYTRSESIEERNDLEIRTGNWQANFTGWGVNGLEKEENVFKKLDANVNYFDYWNDSKFSAYRNFWAEDNNYNSTQGGYPDQFRSPVDRSPVDKEGVNGLKKEGQDKEDTSTLTYLPYTSLAKRETHQYSPENTLNTSVFGSDLKKAYDSQAYLRAGTHVIIGAQLLIEGFEPDNVYNASYAEEDFSDGLIKRVDDKYRMNDIYWAEDAYINYVAEYLGYWMLTAANSELYGSIDGNFYVKDTSVEGGYRLARQDQDHQDFMVAPAYIEGGDGWVWVKPNDGVDLFIKTANESYPYKILPLGEWNSTTASYKKLAFEHKEYMAAHFKDGRMYYAIPVKHNLRTPTDTAPIATGDYGAVRNHWYEFEITSIKSPGTSVDKEDQPIVPNNEPESIGLGVNISILDWHTIEIENVDVNGQPRPEN